MDYGVTKNGLNRKIGIGFTPTGGPYGRKGALRMFKIEIQAEDRRELKMSRDNFIYYKDADGKDSYWEWKHIAGKAAAFDPIFNRAADLVDTVAERLPDLPMTGLR
jgi:hypothetical protein